MIGVAKDQRRRCRPLAGPIAAGMMPAAFVHANAIELRPWSDASPFCQPCRTRCRFRRVAKELPTQNP